MRKLFVSLLLVGALLTLFVPTVALAAVEPLPTTTTTSPVPAEAAPLLQRLDEIQALDKSNLSKADKKALRQEVRHIKKELRELRGGVYLSAGAIIIILLLLILLL